MQRIGLIGLGEIARKRHLPAIGASPAFELAAVADPHGELSGLGVPSFRTHAEMLSSVPDLDAVAICTPPPVRTRVALDAIAAGKHVLVEKPPTATVTEMFVSRAAAEAAGVVLFTAWHSQHNEAVARARALLRDEEVVHISLPWKENFEKYHPGQAWIWRPGGFGVFDAGINGLSILTRIMPQRAYVRAAQLLLRDDAETPIAARIEFGIGSLDGPAGEADLDWRHQGDDLREMTLTTRKGTILRLADSAGTLFVNSEVVVTTVRNEYRDLYDHFARLLTERRSDVDIDPLILAVDALQLGRHVSAGQRA